MPVPVSQTDSSTVLPSITVETPMTAGGSGALLTRSSTASRALRMRLTITCSRRLGMARTGGRAGASEVSSVMPCTTSWRPNRSQACATTPLMSVSSSARSDLRPKARMWLMMSLARSTCPLISTDNSESVSGAMGSLRRVLRRK